MKDDNSSNKRSMDNGCMNIIKAYFKKNTLQITPKDVIQILKSDQVLKRTNDDDNDDDGSTENLLSSLTESCFIISDAFIEQKLRHGDGQGQGRIDLELQQKKFCKYFALRQQQERQQQTREEESSSSLVRTFASLSLRTDTTEGNGNSNDNGTGDGAVVEDNNKSLLEVASRFVALLIMEKDGSIINTSLLRGDIPKRTKNINGKSATSTGSQGKLSSLFGMSKKIYSKASTAVTSVLASYDLAEDPNSFNPQVYDNHGNVDDDDDAFNEKDYSGNVDFDHDDAKEYYLQENQKLHSDINHVSLILDETDILWSVELIIDCCLIVLHHVKQSIATLKVDCNDICEQLTTVTAREGTCSTMSSSSSSPETILDGIILNKIGDGKMSFLVFCHEAGRAARLYSPEDLLLHHSNENVGRILENIILGPSLEVLLLTLVETNNAILSSQGDSVVLIPPLFQRVLGEGKNSYIVNDVDIAAFKLTSTIQSLEKRIDLLTDQSKAMKKRALSSKQAGNTNIAIIHMKRRQILINEIDRCSASLLNLETGLHSLKRAHSDAQIVKAYEMMNNTMKLMREETLLSQVEAVMDEFYDGSEEFQHVQESLGIANNMHDTFYDINELEKELEALVEGNGGDNGPSSSDDGYLKQTPNNAEDSTENKGDEVKDLQQPKLPKPPCSFTTLDQSTALGR